MHAGGPPMLCDAVDRVRKISKLSEVARHYRGLPSKPN